MAVLAWGQSSRRARGTRPGPRIRRAGVVAAGPHRRPRLVDKLPSAQQRRQLKQSAINGSCGIGSGPRPGPRGLDAQGRTDLDAQQRHHGHVRKGPQGRGGTRVEVRQIPTLGRLGQPARNGPGHLDAKGFRRGRRMAKGQPESVLKRKSMTDAMGNVTWQNPKPRCRSWSTARRPSP